MSLIWKCTQIIVIISQRSFVMSFFSAIVRKIDIAKKPLQQFIITMQTLIVW